MVVFVINLEPLSAAPEEGVTVRFQLWKAIQRASVGTLAWLSHEAMSGRDRKQTSRFFGSQRIQGESEAWIHQLLPLRLHKDLVIEQALVFEDYKFSRLESSSILTKRGVFISLKP